MDSNNSPISPSHFLKLILFVVLIWSAVLTVKLGKQIDPAKVHGQLKKNDWLYIFYFISKMQKLDISLTIIWEYNW